MGLFSKDLLISSNVINQDKPSDPYDILFPLKQEYTDHDKIYFQDILNKYSNKLKQKCVDINSI